MPSRVCTHSGEWTPSVWARVTEVLFRVRVRVERRVARRVERIVWNALVWNVVWNVVYMCGGKVYKVVITSLYRSSDAR